MAEGKNYEKEYYRHLGIDMGMYIHMVLCFEMDHIELILFHIKWTYIEFGLYFPENTTKIDFIYYGASKRAGTAFSIKQISIIRYYVL